MLVSKVLKFRRQDHQKLIFHLRFVNGTLITGQRLIKTAERRWKRIVALRAAIKRLKDFEKLCTNYFHSQI